MTVAYVNIESAAQGTEDDKLAELLRETAMHHDGFEKATPFPQLVELIRPLPERSPAREHPAAGRRSRGPPGTSTGATQPSKPKNGSQEWSLTGTKEVAMSTTQVSSDASENAGVKNVDMKLEVVTIPVSDVDRTTEFYVGLGWRQDVTPPGSGIVQLTPSGSSCSVQFGTNRTSAAPGSAQNTFLIVSDIQAARDYLVGRGVAVSGVFHVGRRAGQRCRS